MIFARGGGQADGEFVDPNGGSNATVRAPEPMNLVFFRFHGRWSH